MLEETVTNSATKKSESENRSETPSMKVKTSTSISYRCDTNWIVANGSVESSVTVESSSDSDTETSVSPVVLSPPDPSAPCEIKLFFEQKYEICQIYVRSTARVYEVYYAKSLQGSDEYLCTVRCGVAERDEKLLQATCIEDVAEEHGDYVSGELTDETVTGGRSSPTSEDEWVKIKVPQAGRSCSSDNIQDLYEATAQISDADPCSLLTIRLLSLQDKSHVYVDEIYVYVEPAESTGSGNEPVLASSSAQSSLMAMLVPTLLQLSKSGTKQVQDNNASTEVLKDDKIETAPRKINEIDVERENNKFDQLNLQPKELDNDKANPVELQQPDIAVNTNQHMEEPIHANDMPHGHLERTLEQLITRLSRVEDICLRFEEKMLKPIENMEARLQQVENQLERLAKNSRGFDLPHCTRISAPEFSCSESNSSSLYSDRSDYPPSGPDITHNTELQPSLFVSAPEFSCGEDEERGNDDLKPLKETPCVKPKKTLSVDDALAAALSGLLSSAKVHASTRVDEENQHQGHAESCQSEAQECSDTENGNIESSQYTQILAVKAPDFPAEEIVDDEKSLYYSKSSSDMASANEVKGHGNEMVPPTLQSKIQHTSAESCDFVRTLDNLHLNEGSELNTDSPVEGDTSNDSASDLAKSLVGTVGPETCNETNPRKGISLGNDVRYIDTKKVLDNESESVSDDVQNESEPSCAMLDFEFPILEVNFTSDGFSSTKTPLEALLGGAAELNIEVPSVHDSGDDDGSSEQTNVGNESSDLLPGDDLLVDFGFSSADGNSNLEDESQNMCTPSNLELNVSLDDLHSGTSIKRSLVRNVLCSKCKGKGCTKCKGKGSKSVVFGKLKVSKSVKCSGIRQPAPCMIHQTQPCCSDCKFSCEAISNIDHSKRPQNKHKNVVLEQSEAQEGATDTKEDMQGQMQCAQQ